MGIYDRDYYRTSAARGGFGNFQVWSITTWLIVINIAVYVVDRILVGNGIGWLWGNRILGPIEAYGYFSVSTAVLHGQIWRFITYQFLHAGIGHLFWNMLALYFFGPIIEDYLQPRRYVVFYLACGIADAVSEIVLSYVGILGDGPHVELIGASAAIIGVLIAAATVAPDTEIMLFFPPIPIKLRILACIMIGISVYTVMSNGVNAGGEAAHLGGAIVGFALIKNVHLLNFVVPGRKSVRRHVAFRDWSQDSNH